MKPVILAALVAVCVAIAMADEIEEKRFFFDKGKKCMSDSDCKEGQCCKGRRCRTRCVKKCMSDSDCKEGQCCKGRRCRTRCVKKCMSDSDCKEGQCCKGRRCRTRCVKRCKSDGDCNEEQCCLKLFHGYRTCRAYLKEGDRCLKKSNWGSFIRNCGCADGLECQVKKEEFFMHSFRRRRGKCAVAEGSGDM